MYARYRGPKGGPGLQGERGEPGPPSPAPRPLGRYITSGGSRSLRPDESCIVVLDTDERVTLFLPKIESWEEIPDDALYHPLSITIYCVKGAHCLVSPDKEKKINCLLSRAELNDGVAKYEIFSTPTGWKLMIFKSETGV